MHHEIMNKALPIIIIFPQIGILLLKKLDNMQKETY